MNKVGSYIPHCWKWMLSSGQTIEQNWILRPTLLEVNVKIVAKHYPTLLDETSYRALNLKTWSSCHSGFGSPLAELDPLETKIPLQILSRVAGWPAGPMWFASGYNFVGRAAKHCNIFSSSRIVGHNVCSKANSIQHLIKQKKLDEHHPTWRPNGRIMLDRAKLERWIKLCSIVWPGLYWIFNPFKHTKSPHCSPLRFLWWVKG